MGKYQYGVGPRTKVVKHPDCKVMDATAVIEMAFPTPSTEPVAPRVYSNPPGTKKLPPTMMPSIDNQMTSISMGATEAQVPQKRSKREAKYQANGRHYHKPWPKKNK